MAIDDGRDVIVAVTGATGFCGGAVVRRLVECGHDVVTLGRRPRRDGHPWRRWDASYESPDIAGADAVIHLAAAVGDRRPGTADADFLRVNVDGARRVLDAVGGRRLVWVSTSSVYDTRVDRSSVQEEHPTAAGHLNAYGRTKAVGDRSALDAGAVVLRPRAVYGPGDPHLLPRLRCAVRGGRIVLPGPDVEVSITHVDNLATACVDALYWAPGAYNIADARPVRRDAALTAVLEADLGRPITAVHVPLPIAASVAAGLSCAAHVLRRQPVMTPYAVDTIGRQFVLDTTRATATGWSPRDAMPEYLRHLRDPDRVPTGR